MADTDVRGHTSLKDALASVQAKLQERERERLSIALVGRGGAGKSSLINRLIGRKVCEVGVSTDKTQKAERHEWGHVVFVDLPGYGTRDFSLDRVKSEFGIKDFDMFLWCANGKFLEEDLAIYEVISQTGKPTIFVRTQCDTIYDEEKTDGEIETEIANDLNRLLKRRVELLFVSSNPQYHKFSERLAKLTEAIELHAREAGNTKAKIVYRDFRAFTESFLKKKRDAVEDMVITHSFIAAANGINPIPGVNIAVDLANILAMLRRVSASYDIDEIANIRVFGNPPTWIFSARTLINTLTADGTLTLLKAVGGPVAMQEVVRYVPVLGMVVSAGLGFFIVRDAGLKFVEDCHKTAEEYLKASTARS